MTALELIENEKEFSRMSPLQKRLGKEMLIAFAQFHVTEALEQAVLNAKINNDSCYFEGGHCRETHIINSTIMEAYPLTNII